MQDIVWKGFSDKIERIILLLYKNVCAHYFDAMYNFCVKRCCEIEGGT